MRINRYFIVLLIASIFVIFSVRVESAQAQNIQSNFDNLLNTIKTGNAYQKKEAIPSFAGIDDQRVVPVLIDLLEDQDESVRASSAYQLARLADKRSTDALVKALSNEYDYVRRYAAEGLIKIGEKKHVPALVESIFKYLPDPNKNNSSGWSSAPAFEAIGKLSPKAPAEIVQLLKKIEDDKIIDNESWWAVLPNVANCLGSIADKSAYQPLKQAQQSLETNYQDYKTWYAVRKALAAIDPKKEPFNRPAADILQVNYSGKVPTEQEKLKWIAPLVALGNGAINDLDWATKFTKQRDNFRYNISIEALSRIGGKSAQNVLLQLIQNQFNLPDRDRQRAENKIRDECVALLNTNPDIHIVKQVITYSNLLTVDKQMSINRYVFSTSKVPFETKIIYFDAILSDNNPEFKYKVEAGNNKAILLAQKGGQMAGEDLSNMIFTSTISKNIKITAIEALGTIKDYDSIPTLIKASSMSYAPVEAIAKTMGKIADKRAIPTLQKMSSNQAIDTQARLWTAAALARMNVDYSENAKIIRDKLPDSLEQAKWLNDKETIDAVASFIKDEQSNLKSAIDTLTAIGTDYAFEVLTAKIDLEKMTNPDYEKQLCIVAWKIADKLGFESKQYYNEVALVINETANQFRLAQMQAPPPEAKNNFEVLKRYPALVRKVWIIEATKRLDSAKDKKASTIETYIPYGLMITIPVIYDSELVPVLERIVAENTEKNSFHGKTGVVDFYYTRSQVAKLLTEKTGRAYTFVDVDGRIHPGGWNPSQEK
jgi:HEAT repeat protein